MSDEQSAPSSYASVFEAHFPYYLSIGMSYEEYWNGDCDLVKAYRKAEELRNHKRNQELWLQGMYVYEALLNASPMFHDFAKSGTKPIPYPTEPYPLTDKDAKEREAREERRKMLAMRRRMEEWASAVNKSKKGGETDG